jgi:hypothetical protein
MGHVQLFSDYLAPVYLLFPFMRGVEHSEWIIQLVTMVLSLYRVYLGLSLLREETRTC